MVDWIRLSPEQEAANISLLEEKLHRWYWRNRKLFPVRTNIIINDDNPNGREVLEPLSLTQFFEIYLGDFNTRIREVKKKTNKNQDDINK